MSEQTVNPNKNIKPFEAVTDEAIGAAEEIKDQQKKSTVFRDIPNNKIENMEQEFEATFQRRPQFRLNENNRRRFY